MSTGLRRWGRALAVLALLSAFVLLWPVQLGGRASMLVTVGNSMAPHIRQGDIAFIRKAPPYRVGEIVAYRSGTLRQVALHRVIDVADGRYVLKGDNNDWVDTYRPGDGEVVGRLWLHVPRAGAWLDWIRRPRELALLTGLVALLVTTGIRQARKRMQRRRRTGQPPGRGARTRPKRPLSLPLALPALVPPAGSPARALWTRVAAAGAIAALLGATVATIGATQPATRVEQEPIPYRHTAAFSYRSESADGRIMDRAGDGAGAPVYLRLANQLPVRFAYTLEAEDVRDAAGTYRLLAVLADNKGWRRTIELRPTAAFEGTSFEAAGTLTLPGVQALVRRFEEATGVEGGPYELRVILETHVRATLDGERLDDEFRPQVLFDLDTLTLRPRPAEEGHPFAPVEDDMLTRDVRRANRLRVAGVSLPVRAMRDGGAGLALLGALVAWVALRARGRAPADGPAERIALRYGSRIVDVERVEPRPDERLVRLTDVRDLVRIADSLDAPVLHAREGGLHRYLVQEGTTTYCYEVADTDRSERPALLAPQSWPAPQSWRGSQSWPSPPEAGRAPGRLPAPAVEIDLAEPLPPAPIGSPRPRPGGLGLPPAPPRRPR